MLATVIEWTKIFFMFVMISCAFLVAGWIMAQIAILWDGVLRVIHEWSDQRRAAEDRKH